MSPLRRPLRSLAIRKSRLPASRTWPELVKKNPRLFFANGTITQYSTAVIDILKKLREGGQIGNKSAMVNVADEFGIESANISRKLLPAAGFEIVYDNPIRSVRKTTRR